MNLDPATMTDWGLRQVVVPKPAVIQDVGCGGGTTVLRLAALAPQRASPSPETRIKQGSVAELPFSNGTFDSVTAVETHYYWPDLSANVREILTVLQPPERSL